jgi:sugar PTS system EIIA component
VTDSPDVVAPVPGKVIALADVPDPVFAQQIVGSGVAIDPERSPGTAVSPVAGRLLKLHPHAFVVLTAAGQGVLVHLGIDTVQLDGEGFELVATEGDELASGDPIVRWDPAVVEAGGRSPIVPVVVMDTAADTVSASAIDSTVEIGDPLF